MKARGYERIPSNLFSTGFLLARAYFGLACVAAELRTAGFRHFIRRVPDARSGAPVGAEALRRARRYARWIELASRHHCCSTHCLERSATLHLWLRREGLPSELRIGVVRQGQSLAAHAWVELDGAAINERPQALAPFTPLFDERRSVMQQGTRT